MNAQGNKYVVVAKIKELQPEQPWWYMACTTCKSGTRFDGQRYTCRNTACNSTGGIERYIPNVCLQYDLRP